MRQVEQQTQEQSEIFAYLNKELVQKSRSPHTPLRTDGQKIGGKKGEGVTKAGAGGKTRNGRGRRKGVYVWCVLRSEEIRRLG